MRFSWKIALASMLVSALALSLGGWLLIEGTFQDALERAVARSLAENLAAARELAMSAYVESGGRDGVEYAVLVNLAAQLARERADGLRLESDAGGAVYATMAAVPMRPDGAGRTYRLAAAEAGAALQAAIELELGGQRYVLMTQHDVSYVFDDRDAQFHDFRRLGALILAASALLMLWLSGMMTRPIRRLTRAAARIERGEYGRRVPEQGGAELTRLAAAFNRMAGSVAGNVERLTQEARQRDEFVENFTHELKTPLTSIIGYADMLRSQRLPPERAFAAANYIYSEGRRLEALERKLMELYVAGNTKLDFVEVRAAHLAAAVEAATAAPLEAQGMRLVVRAQDAKLRVEPDLLRTALINLVDNARKASDTGAQIELVGAAAGPGYVFSVIDHGRGMPKEELARITEAFYMIDKSRARAQQGAGLGLALCERIARLHGGRLQFESEPGQGTTARLLLRARKGGS